MRLNWKEILIHFGYAFALAVIVLACMTYFTSCCRTITQEQLHEYQAHNKVLLDSITKTHIKEVTKHDSIYVYNNVYTKGDTVFVEKYKVQYNTLIQRQNDTIFKLKTVTDTITNVITKESVKTKEVKHTPIYMEILLGVFGILALVFGGLLYAGVAKKL